MSPFKGRWRLLAFGFLLAFFSSLGQTSFIAVFGTALREEFNLTSGGLGSIYSFATLATGLLLPKVGGLIDRFPLRLYAGVVVCGLGLGAAAIASANGVLGIVLAFFVLRLFGHGLMTHVTITAMAREFDRMRGRAIAVATSGIPAGEAIFPILAAFAIAAVGWRGAWFSAAAVCILVVFPVAIFLIRSGGPAAPAASGPTFSVLTFLRRREMLLALPSFMSSGFIITAVVFHQGLISQEKGWPLAIFPSFFFTFGIAAIVSTLIWGWLVDRLGAWRLASVFLLPLAVGCMALALSDSTWVVPTFLACAGVTFAGYFPILTALLADYYGIRQLGAMRATTASLLTISTALSPALIGLLIDLGVRIEALAGSFCALILCAAAMVVASDLTRPVAPAATPIGAPEEAGAGPQ